MAMRINTNVPSLNTQRILGQTSAQVARTIGRLSSGFRINRAADDAAGLGIANKLRADTRSLRQAARNAEQSNSLLQVAEGAAQTVQSILERMKELATQSSSDNTDAAGRGRINAEFQNLRSEITRIIDTTKFQGSALLNGTFGNQVDTNVASSTVLAAGKEVQSVQISGVGADTYTVTHAANSLTLTNSAGDLTQVLDITGQDGVQTFTFDAFGISLTTTSGFVAATATASGDIVVTGASASFMVSSSGAYTTDDLISLTSMDMTVTTLGIDLSDLSTAAGAQAALTDIDGALASVATTFGEIGSAQNRIDFAFQNVQTSIENFAAAESTIRDADMAAEMAEFTRGQILQQAGVAMLAQANSFPQAVLALLQ